MSGFGTHTDIFRDDVETHYPVAYPSDYLAWPNETDPTEGTLPAGAWVFEFELEHLETEPVCAGPEPPERTKLNVNTYFYHKENDGTDGFEQRAEEIKTILANIREAGVQILNSRYLNPKPSERKSGWIEGGLSSAFEVNEPPIGGGVSMDPNNPTVSVTAHGFAVGDLVTDEGGSWRLAGRSCGQGTRATASRKKHHPPQR